METLSSWDFPYLLSFELEAGREKEAVDKAAVVPLFLITNMIPKKEKKPLQLWNLVFLTLFKLRAALSFPPGVRFLSCTSNKPTN